MTLKVKRKEEIFSAALQCFIERGYADTSISAIAARANISKGGLYHYFPSKRELFLALFLFRVQRYSEEINQHLKYEVSPEKRLRILVAQTSRLLVQNEDFYRFCLEFLAIGARDTDIRAVMTSFYKETVGIFCRIVNDGIDAGVFTPVDAGKVGRMLYFAVMGSFFTFFSVDPDFTFSDQLSFQVEFILKAL